MNFPRLLRLSEMAGSPNDKCECKENYSYLHTSSQLYNRDQKTKRSSYRFQIEVASALGDERESVCILL